MEVNDSTMNGEPSTSNTSAVTTDGVSTTRKAEEAAVTPSANKVLYGVEDCPPWYLCAFFSLQVGSFRHATNSVIKFNVFVTDTFVKM